MINLKQWKEECAVFGVSGDPEASYITYLGLYAQQHRGQEATGIISQHKSQFMSHKGKGLVGEVYPDSELEKLKGDMAIGHVRYSTAGENFTTNIQPLVANLKTGIFALSHNGNLTNGHQLRKKLISDGAIFQGTNDTEIILHLLARSPHKDIIQCIKDILSILEGAFSLVCMTANKMIAVRDTMGFRPLVLGQKPLKAEENQKATVLASETCAFDLIGAKYLREIEPGEIYWTDKDGEHSEKWTTSPLPRPARCSFEHVYFARPDSNVFGKNVYEARKEMGRILSKESHIDGDLVIPVPDSGVPAAIGYSQGSGIPFDLGIIRNHYIGRTFIQPIQSIRSLDVKIKLNPQKEIIAGKRVIIIDDSIVRGTTSQKIIRLVRQAGAKEIHFKVASPPSRGACYYGVDTPEDKDLIATKMSIEEIKEFIDADSLSYLSMDGLVKAISGSVQKPREAGLCVSCFDRNYPTPIPQKT